MSLSFTNSKKIMNAELVSHARIWNQAPHNAMTDLLRFRNRWFCAFREGSNHISPDGKIRILTSIDGSAWSAKFLLEIEGLDLRDPKLSITSDGHLMLNAAAAYPQPASKRHQSLVWFGNGESWGKPVEIGPPDMWLWRVTWHRGIAYSIGYHTTDPGKVSLFTSRSGAGFELAADDLFTHGFPNEASLAFAPNDIAYCLLRRETEGATARLGRAVAPYTQWSWKDCGIRVGGPHLMILPDGRMMAAIRRYGRNPWTSLNWLNPETGAMIEILALPSGGDNSYGGLAWHEGMIWTSYYSSHEEQTCIYLARVKIDG
jgi:hypothetical protein